MNWLMNFLEEAVNKIYVARVVVVDLNISDSRFKNMELRTTPGLIPRETVL